MGGNGGAASASSSKGRYARLDNELERNNQDFIEDQFQQQQVWLSLTIQSMYL